MKGLLILYVLICVLAAGLNFLIKAIQKIRGRKAAAHPHEQEHDRAHIIKFIILFILALAIAFYSALSPA